jgi:hypothetical protein
MIIYLCVCCTLILTVYKAHSASAYHATGVEIGSQDKLKIGLQMGIYEEVRMDDRLTQSGVPS